MADKTKCSMCDQLMHEVDEHGCCFRCDLHVLFGQLLDGEAGSRPGTHMGVALSLVELVRMRILQRLVLHQKPADQFVQDVYTGMASRQGRPRG